MTKSPTQPKACQRLQIIETDTHRLLRNASEVEATFIALTSTASLWHVPDEGDVVTSASPCVALRNLPAGHDVVLEAVDPYEDGHLTFTLVRAEWADGRLDVGRNGDPSRTLPQFTEVGQGGLGRLASVALALQESRPIPERPAPPPRVDLDIETLCTVPGSVSFGLLDPDKATSEPIERSIPTCATCEHSREASVPERGVDCAHPAHNSSLAPEGTN